MCSIFGLYHFADQKSFVDLGRVSRATRLRGPDAEGFYSDASIDLVHRRLAIIDTSERANQPFFNSSKTRCIVFNGEIFNYQDLKKTYLHEYDFSSDSDTEVILYLYEKFGERCAEKLNGNFAFAIWDCEKRELFLARDRFGTRPLYYYNDHRFFIFCSEMRGIFSTGLVPQTITPDGVIEYFAFQNFLGEDTLYQGIKLVPAGTTMIVRNQRIIKRTFWDPVFSYEHDKGTDYYCEHLRFLLEQAISRQMIRDPGIFLGSYLSGGIDSGLIVALASRHISHLLTFTCGWNMAAVRTHEAEFDERRYAEILASHFYTTHHEIVLNHGDMEWMVHRVARVLEEPRMGMSYSNQYIARLAAKFVKICFSGSGGDEIFGGYPWRYRILQDLDVQDQRAFENVHYPYWLRLIGDLERFDFFSSDFVSNHKDLMDLPLERYRAVFRHTDQEFRNPIDKALYFDMKTFLHGLLVNEDKISMNYSMETRTPFLDNDLVDFALSLPTHYKTDGDLGKILLREIARDILPAEIAYLKKQGFSSPDQAWYQSKSFEFVRRYVLHPEVSYFNQSYLAKVLDEHQSGIRNHRLLLWSLLNFNLIASDLIGHRGHIGLGVDDSVLTDVSYR